jgi:elongation factor G
MAVEVMGPEEFQGTVMGQLNKRHGIITGSDGLAGWFTVHAEVSKPLPLLSQINLG